MKATAFIVLIVAALPVLAMEYSALPESERIGKHPKAAVPFDLRELKAGWRQRLEAILEAGVLPIIDVQSSFKPGKLDARDYARAMDEHGVALTAFSPQIGRKKYNRKGALWHDGARRAVAADPTRFIPASTAGIYPAFTEEPAAFVAETIAAVEAQNYPLMGEFEFRHYMSPRQYRRGKSFRDVAVPIDSAAGRRLFAFSARTGTSFQIHYEVEERLMAELEDMLARYPDARVIWSHLGQVRFSERAGGYGPDYVRRLIETHSNIYFDLAFGDADAVYPGSGEHHATVWEAPGRVKAEWVELIEDHPYRFLAALDIGGDRMHKLGRKTATLRRFLANLSEETRHIVAYKAAWRLLFGETI